ncbi:MAG TPA: acyl carrier protein [Coleofasciculaceae cyanobacterium]
MSQQEIFEKVKAIVVEQLEVEEEQVTPTATFTSDLGADSLDAVELIMALEEAFEIVIPDEDAEEMGNVEQVVHYITHVTNSTAESQVYSY